MNSLDFDWSRIDELPLGSLRVVDVSDDGRGYAGRLLADMGADVLLVEPPEGRAGRRAAPIVQGRSCQFEVENCNKKSLCLDLSADEGIATCKALIANCDVVILGRESIASGLKPAELRQDYPSVIVVAITDFGLTGPWCDWQATNAVLMAEGGVLARSGIKGHDPLLPPGNLADVAASVQACWAIMLALWQRQGTGSGNLLDFSLLEATAQILDPGLGVTGSAAGGKSATKMATLGRPPVGKLYPIFPCADGHVRICVLNPRQWQGMSDWLGADHPFRDPKYGRLAERFAVIRDINALISELFSKFTAEELVSEGQRRGVPIAAVSTPQQVLANSHFKARKAFVDYPLDNAVGRLASGFFEVDGLRLGPRFTAPEAGEHQPELEALITEQRTAQAGPTPARKRPFEGLRVLDLGVIVAGAELGRMFADHGAELIKVENSAFPDGLRQTTDGSPISESFAQGSRNKLSLGLNLRHEQGLKLFEQLVAKSDIVLTNFKPGTMESLGIGYERLCELNPRIILVESSALGNTGPLAKSMGYGPLVRASSGLTGLWRYPELADSYSDSTTIFPDHLAGRLAAIAVVSALWRRETEGRGAKVVLSQAEAILNCMAAPFLRESLKPGSLQATGNVDVFHAPSGVFPCAGDDQWCVIDVRNEQHWRALCEATGYSDWLGDANLASAEERVACREALHERLAKWTRAREVEAVVEQCQQAGVPAGKMLRLVELPQHPQLLARHFFRTFEQPGLGELLTENSPAGISELPDPKLRPAPLQGRDTRLLAESVLGLSVQQIEQYIAEGVLEAAD
ncbi:CoA transferase [Spongiibacter sp. KMU-166]|uniref:CoA transferase n=1 Tax=Spongiibacter thalassae TaxID=2721624 RepID=A0ABX1GAG4_9GAMM|nr:CoA transferase [Spongiibacter thalassae]NKI16146.1 CoA transferase [Spongiibacter thalassae]